MPTWPQSLLAPWRSVARAVGLYPDAGTGPRNMLQGIWPGSVGEVPPRGTLNVLRAYTTMPWLRAVTHKVGDAISTVEWQLFVARSNGRARRMATIQRMHGHEARQQALLELKQVGELEQVEQHPMLDALDRANSFMVGISARKITQVYLDLVGEAFWLKERNQLGLPAAFWPLPPNWITGTPTPSNRVYRISYRGWQTMIPETEILWMTDPNPENPYGRGSGTAHALADELEADEYAARHTKQLFMNRARPDVLVSMPDADQSELRRLQEDWLSQLSGYWRAWRPYFVNQDMKVQEFSQSHRALQFIQIREHERSVVLQTFGIPPEMLGVLVTSNRATISAADLFFARYVLAPRLEFMRATFQERLVPEYDPENRLIVHYVTPVSADAELQLDAARAAPYALLIDEWRKLQGLDPLPDNQGQVLMVPFNMAPVTPDGLATGMPAPAQTPQQQHLATAVNRAVGSGNGHKPAKRSTEKPANPADFDELTRRDMTAFNMAASYWPDGSHGRRDHTKRAKQVLQLLSDELEDLLPLPRLAAREETALRRVIVRSVRETRERIDLAAAEAALARRDLDATETAYRFDLLDAALLAAIPVLLRRVYLRAAEIEAQALRETGSDVTFATDHPRVAQWDRTVAAAVGVGFVARSRSAFRRAALERLAEESDLRKLTQTLRDVEYGLSEPQRLAVRNFRRRLEALDPIPVDIDRRIQRYAEATLRVRGAVTARTELMRAVHQGQHEIWTQAAEAGVLDLSRTRKVWVAIQDDRLEAVCEALDGTEVGIYESFPGGALHPPIHINCVPGTTLITPSGRITAQMERWHEGDLVIIRTASGQQLACTPNHPILTPVGWLPAHLAYEGGYVFRSLGLERMRLVGADNQHVPAMIEEIAHAFRQDPSMGAHEVPLAPKHLHGDGKYSQVAVVRANRLVRDDVSQAIWDEPIEQSLFVGAEKATFSPRRHTATSLERHRLSPNRLMGSFNLSLPFFRSHLAPLQKFGAASATDGDLMLEQDSADDRPADPQLIGQRFGGRAPQVALDELGIVNNQSARHFGFSRDRIVRVEHQWFSGRVYNLETESGWYIANGIVTHNCRCSVILVRR